VKGLQRIGSDLAARLMAIELQLRTRSMETRMLALEDFGAIVACIDLFRLEIETQDPPPEDFLWLLARFDRKVSSIQRSQAYRVAEWFDAAELKWYVNPATPMTAMC
jgi:hypothetical protein